MNERTVLVCDNEETVLQQIKEGLVAGGFSVETISDAAQLINRATGLGASVVIVNPDMNGFNEYDVCKKLMKEKHIPVILLLDRSSTRRAQVGECDPEDTVTKPLEVNNLVNLVSKHYTVTSNSVNDR